jgi:hypothetical protein
MSRRRATEAGENRRTEAEQAISNDPAIHRGSSHHPSHTCGERRGVRHTCVMRLLKSCQSPMIASIMRRSASTRVRMAQRYGHFSTDARRAAMEAMSMAGRNVAETEIDDAGATA